MEASHEDAHRLRGPHIFDGREHLHRVGVLAVADQRWEGVRGNDANLQARDHLLRVFDRIPSLRVFDRIPSLRVFDRIPSSPKRWKGVSGSDSVSGSDTDTDLHARRQLSAAVATPLACPAVQSLSLTLLGTP